MSLLEVSELRAGYGQVNVLHEVALAVDEGEIVVVLGANGAGKTTTIRAISGTIPRAGTVTFAGRSIVASSAEAIVRTGIAQVPQAFAIEHRAQPDRTDRGLGVVQGLLRHRSSVGRGVLPGRPGNSARIRLP